MIMKPSKLKINKWDCGNVMQSNVIIILTITTMYIMQTIDHNVMVGQHIVKYNYMRNLQTGFTFNCFKSNKRVNFESRTFHKMMS